jgi:hypothetical protein
MPRASKSVKYKVSKPEAPEAPVGPEVAAAVQILSGAMSVERRRDLKQITESAIYIMSIRIGTGVKTVVKIGFKDLNLPPAVVKQLERMGAGEIRITAFEGVREAYSALSSKRKFVQRHHMRYFDPTWFVAEPDLMAVALLIEDAMSLLPELRGQMAVSYDIARKRFRRDLMRLLSSAWANPEPSQRRARKEEILRIVDEKEMEFPALEDCQDGLTLDVDYLGRVPSIKEQIEVDVELAELATREMENDGRRQTLILEKELEAQTMRSRRKMMEAVQRDAIDNIYRAIAEGIAMVEKDLARGNVHSATRKRIEEQIARLDSSLVMLKESGSLEELAAGADAITDLCDRNARGEQDLSARIAGLREWLRPKVEERGDASVLDLLVSGMV